MTVSHDRDQGMPVSLFLRANLGRIILAILVFGALGWLLGLARARTSVAEATVLLENPFSVEVFAPLRTDSGDLERFVNDQVAYLKSTDFALEVADAMGMQQNADSAAEVLSRISVTAVPDSSLVEIEFNGDSSADALDGIRTVVEIYATRAEASVTEPYELALQALTQSIATFDDEIDATQLELSSLRDAATQEERGEYQSLLDEIQGLRAQLVSTPTQDIPAITAQINALATQANLVQNQISNASNDPELIGLVGRLNDAAAQQTTLANRRSELQVQLASAPSPVAATALPAEADLATPSAVTSALVGAFAGLIVGIGWAYYLIDDRRRRFVDELEPRAVLGSELLGAVRLDSRSPLLVLQHPESPAYSVFSDVNKRLATSMNGTSKALGVASTALDPTKSQVALNIALMGADNGKRTLFIDGDMESHTASQILSQILDRPRDVGLAEILGGERDLTGVIQTLGTNDGTLHFIPSGKFAPSVAPSPSQLKEVIDALEEHYDLVVIDLPQRLDSPSVDAYSKANVDVIVAVRDGSRVRSGYETRSRLDSAGVGQLGYLYTYRPRILSGTA